MIIIIDNYDSFTYNLVQYLGELGTDTDVHRNDKITIDEVLALKPKALIISPGPSVPDNAGICLKLVASALKHDIPLLGVCLGHQCIGQALGGKIIQDEPVHGKVSTISHSGTGIFKDISTPLDVTRYHSLIIERETLPEELEITASTDDDIIMGIAHKNKPIHGVQFHPESIATSSGMEMLKNFIDLI